MNLIISYYFTETTSKLCESIANTHDTIKLDENEKVQDKSNPHYFEVKVDLNKANDSTNDEYASVSNNWSSFYKVNDTMNSNSMVGQAPTITQPPDCDKFLDEKKWSSPSEAPVFVTEHHIYCKLLERCPSPEYTEVIIRKKTGKSVEMLVSTQVDNSSTEHIHEYEVFNTDSITEQHHYSNTSDLCTDDCEGKEDSVTLDYSMPQRHHHVNLAPVNPHESGQGDITTA